MRNQGDIMHLLPFNILKVINLSFDIRLKTQLYFMVSLIKLLLHWLREAEDVKYDKDFKMSFFISTQCMMDATYL